MQRLITTNGDVILNALRVHNAAIRTHDPHLLRKKRMVGIAHLHIARTAFKRTHNGRGIFRLHKFK